MLKVKNETSTSAEIYIYGTIIDDEDATWYEYWKGKEGIDGYQFPQELRRQLDGLKGKELTVYINSYGGSIPAGVAMANMIKRHDARTTAIVDGYCCSIATQIFFSANKCRMHKNSYLMIHKPFSYVMGNAIEMRKAAEALDTLQEGLESTYMSKVLENVTSQDIHNMVEDEIWLTGEEAIKTFEIELMESQKTLNCFGSLDKLKAMGAKKIPQSLNFISGEKLSPPKQVDWSEIKIALARAKGAVINC